MSADRAFNLEVDGLPDGTTPLEVFAIVKRLDSDGGVCLISKSSAGLCVWDVIGMLTVALDSQRAAATQSMIPDDEEDE